VCQSSYFYRDASRTGTARTLSRKPYSARASAFCHARCRTVVRVAERLLPMVANQGGHYATPCVMLWDYVTGPFLYFGAVEALSWDNGYTYGG